LRVGLIASKPADFFHLEAVGAIGKVEVVGFRRPKWENCDLPFTISNLFMGKELKP